METQIDPMKLHHTLKAFLLLSLLGSVLLSYGQSDLRRVNVSGLPEDIRNLPDISIALRWTDSLGDNIVVNTQRIHRPDDDRVFTNAPQLLKKGPISFQAKEKPIRNYYKESPPPYVHHFLLVNDSAVLWRKIAGTGLNCDDKTKGSRVKSAMAVTDLNKDKVAELWLILKAVCTNDEAPNAMKMVMYTGDKKHVMSGTRTLRLGGKTLGGQYHFDEGFRKAPEAFRRYAVLLWKRNMED